MKTAEPGSRMPAPGALSWCPRGKSEGLCLASGEPTFSPPLPVMPGPRAGMPVHATPHGLSKEAASSLSLLCLLSQETLSMLRSLHEISTGMHSVFLKKDVTCQHAPCRLTWSRAPKPLHFRAGTLPSSHFEQDVHFRWFPQNLRILSPKRN